MYYIYPYKAGSRSARSLVTALEGKLIKREGSHFQPRQGRHVINWGSSSCPSGYGALNPSHLTRVMGNKLDTFRLFSLGALQGLQELTGVTTLPRVPRWTESRQEALQWLSDGVCKKVVCRNSLTGHSGYGIIIHTSENSPTDLPVSPLYVEYIPKDAEYRIHVFKFGEEYEVVDVQRKVRDPSREPLSWEVRSHGNGFIFTRNDSQGRSHLETVPEDVLTQGKLALGRSGLSFGGVDICWNDKRKQAFVLEINTAVGLEGSTIGIYRDAFKRKFET